MKDEFKESVMPRFTKLDMFNPHRTSFECKYEAAVNPPITPEAEALFQQALALSSFELWPEKRDHAKTAALYEQAMRLGHWKAQFNLAGAYLQGSGVPQDIEKAIQLTEDLMRKGVPAAWDNMGSYYMGGVGSLKQDATVAYAFWQKAADMGSMSAQTYLGAKLDANHDEPPSFWGNRQIGLKMLECAFAQGSAQAALELGVTLANIDHAYDHALEVFHEGVKRGSEKSANYLSSSFDLGDAIAENVKDKTRSERYGVLADALYSNPDLRFPNLDKVLPLPPAKLPVWDGNKESLINAAKAIVPVPLPPEPPAHPASQLSGRAHIPPGWLLPERPQVEVPAQYETTSAPASGYWLARLMLHTDARHVDWDQAQLPQHYNTGELFDRSRTGLRPEDGRIQFHYLGEAVPWQPEVAADNALVTRGIACYGVVPEPTRRSPGHATCPATGVWSARLPCDHARAPVFNRWDRQAYVVEGRRFPDPRAEYLDIEARDVEWRWLDNANEMQADGRQHVTVPRRLRPDDGRV